MGADYSSALTLLLRYPSPNPPTGPQSLIQDALYLSKHRTREAAASLVERYSGRRPTLLAEQRLANHQRGKPAHPVSRDRWHAPSASYDELPGRSGSRLSHQQKNLENLFQEVSGGLQRRTENWSLSKAVRGAVGEVRRNVSSINSAASSPRRVAAASRETLATPEEPEHSLESLTARINALETRNRLLAKMLGGALESLRTHKHDDKFEDAFNISLAKIQFVQVYLDDPEIPIPPEPPEPERKPVTTQVCEEPPAGQSGDQQHHLNKGTVSSRPSSESLGPSPAMHEKTSTTEDPRQENPTPTSTRNLSRPSLAQSSFSWMLGQDRHRSSFVSSASAAPEEERRGSETQHSGRPKHLFKDGKTDESRKGSQSEDNGFTMNSLQADTKTS